MSAIKKYFKTKKEAIVAYEKRRAADYGAHIFKMPKGTRKHGWYVICTHLEFISGVY